EGQIGPLDGLEHSDAHEAVEALRAEGQRIGIARQVATRGARIRGPRSGETGERVVEAHRGMPPLGEQPYVGARPATQLEDASARGQEAAVQQLLEHLDAALQPGGRPPRDAVLVLMTGAVTLESGPP